MIEVCLLDYPKYIIREDGAIFSTSTKKGFIRPGLTKDGYHQANLMSHKSRNRYRHSIKVHRVVALAFVDNPNGYNEVNHIDGNKLNNHRSNLEWCSRSYNISHCHRIGLRSSKGVHNGNYKTGKYISL